MFVDCIRKMKGIELNCSFEEVLDRPQRVEAPFW